MEEQERIKILDSLKSGRHAIVGALNGVSEEVAVLIPAPEKWSILQCVEHLALAEEYLFAKMTTARPSDKPVPNAGREAAIQRRGYDRSFKIEAPDVARPRGTFSTLREAKEHFLSSRQRTIEFVEEYRADPRAMLTEHPLIGQVNCYEQMLIMAAHPHRHSQQIAEIKAAVGQKLPS